MKANYFFFAGEVSGDLHGSRLMSALKADTVHMSGVGGPLMRAEGLKAVLPMEEFQVMGFTDVIKSLPKLWKHFYFIRNAILKQKPDAVILIDYPGFNLRLANALRKKGYAGKIIQYICPTVWAHGKKRIQTLVQNMDLVLTIYPFEKQLFAHTSLTVKYIGNPVVETVQNHVYHNNWKEQNGFPENPFVALFPGSRLSEIYRHLPMQLQAAAKLKAVYPYVRFALSYAQESLIEPIERIIAQSHLKIGDDLFLVPKAFNYELMRDCRAALAKPGTVSLELALHNCPTVIMYKVDWFNYCMAKYILRLKLSHFCIVNILGGNKDIFPEFIGKAISFDDYFNQVNRFYHDETIRKYIQSSCREVKQQLGSYQTSQMAAQAIRELLSC